jgi:hypothetical protein
MSGFNYEKGKTRLSHIINQLLLAGDVLPPLMIYAGSTPASEAMPNFAGENVMPLLNPGIKPRLWLGNSSRVAAPYNNSRNIARCIAGTRRRHLHAFALVASCRGRRAFQPLSQLLVAAARGRGVP